MRLAIALVVCAPAIAFADAAVPPTVEVGLSFDGHAGSGSPAADPGGGVGSKIVEVTAGAVTFRNYGTGEVFATSTADAFWTAAGIAGTPAAVAQHAFFDPQTQRWYATAEQATTGPNRIYIASTESWEPMATWKAIALPPQAAAITNTHVAVDPAGLYITGDSGGQSIVMAVPLQDLKWSGTGAPTAAHLNVFTLARTGVVPAIDPLDTILHESRFFLARELGAGTTKIDVYRLDWNGSVLDTQTTAVMSAATVVDLGVAYPAPSRPAQQPPPGPWLDAGNGALTSASATIGYIAGIAESEQNGHLAPMWFELSASASTPGAPIQVVQHGVVTDFTRDFIAPAIAIESYGTLGIVMVGTDVNEPPSIYLAGQGPYDPRGSLRQIVLGRAGTAPYSCAPIGAVSQFGRYSTISSTGSGFWAIAQVGASTTDCEYHTAWLSFDVPSPSHTGDPGGWADGGFGDHPSSHPFGCGCASSSGEQPIAGALLLAAIVFRRRRRATISRR